MNEYCSTRPKSGNFCSKHISSAKTGKVEVADSNPRQNVCVELDENHTLDADTGISKSELELDLQQLDLYELEKDELDSEYEELFALNENDVYDDEKCVSEKSSDEDFVLSQSSAEDIDDTLSQSSDNDEDVSVDGEFLDEE